MNIHHLRSNPFFRKGVATRTLLLCLIIAVFGSSHCACASTHASAPANSTTLLNSPKNVLVLFSYHRAEWSDNIQKGIESVFFSHQNVNFFFEYMDTKRLKTKEYLETLRKIYTEKYAKAHIDVILCVDNNALELLVENPRTLLPEIPVVFCGINDYKPALHAARPYVTGVVEYGDFTDTLKIAFKARPKATKLYIVGDHTETGESNTRELLAILSTVAPNIEAVLTDQMSYEELSTTLQTADPQQVAFFVSFWKDGLGRTIEPWQLDTIFKKAAIPIFGRSEWMINRGMVGGKCVTGFGQGEAAARIALKILGGTPVSVLPVDTNSPNQYLFDQRMMQHHLLDIAIFPKESIGFNSPEPFYRIQKPVGITILVFSALLLAALVFLAVNIHRRKRAEENLRTSEQRMRLLFERQVVGMAITSPAKGWVQVNNRLIQMLGFSREELSCRTWEEMTHPEDIAADVTQFNRVLSGEIDEYSLENRFFRKDGAVIFTNLSVGCVRREDGTVNFILATVADITERKQAEEALQRSEEKFRQIITTVREGILSLDADWCITFANAHLAKMFGYDLDELLGQSFEVFLHEEDLEDFARRKHERQQGQYSQFERRFKTKDGREIWAIVSASAFKDDKGDFAGSFGTITDITERKRAEQMLRESEEQLSSILRSAPIGIGLVVNRELMSVNSRLCEMTGFDAGDLIGQSSRILYPSNEDFEFVGREKYAQIRDHGTGTVETHWQRKDGTIIEILLSSTPIDMVDHSKGVTFTALDITERKQVERFLRDIIAKNPMSIQILDKDGLTIEANHAYKSLFGAVPPSGYSLFTDPQLLQIGIGELFDRLRNGATVSFPDTYFNAHDSVPEFPDDPAWVRAIGFPLNDSSGKPEKFVLMHENITERKEHEKEQLKNEKLGSLGILAGGIAHDFNNILTAIMGNISLAKVFLDSTHKSYTPLAEAEKASARAGELAHQLLTFARGGEPIKKVVAPQHLVNEAVSLMLHGSNVKAIIDIHDLIHAIEADEGQMSQVFHNLIINATQAMPGGGTLMVTALNEVLSENNSLSLPPGTYIRLTFADQGCGISDDDLKRIFDPYFTTKSAGNGLGLASVHSIINRHGGHIGVSSVVGKGTTFTIFLPSLGEIYTKFQTGIATQVTGGHKGGSLLVMDDEEMIRDIASSILTHLGYEVTTCADGEEAVELYKNSIESGTPFSAVIMDLTIPGGLGGKEAAKQILSVFPKACLIVSSGYSNDPIMSSYREYGFSGTIAKPYNIHEFKQVLGSLFAQY